MMIQPTDFSQKIKRVALVLSVAALGVLTGHAQSQPATLDEALAQLAQMQQQLEALQQQVAELEAQLARLDAPQTVQSGNEPSQVVNQAVNQADMRTKLGDDLVRLYQQYQTHQQQNPERAFQPQNQRVPVEDGYVLIDAVANDSATALRTELERHGLVDASSFGRVVSGMLPILALDDIALLDNLRSARIPLAN